LADLTKTHHTNLFAEEAGSALLWLSFDDSGGHAIGDVCAFRIIINLIRQITPMRN